MKARHLTGKQERFSHGIVEGLSQSEAFRRAYNAREMSDQAVAVEASRLARDPRVKKRVSELRETLQRTLGISRISLLLELDEVLELARTRADGRTMIAAIVTKGRLCGFFDSLPKPISSSERQAQDMLGEPGFSGRGE